MQQLSSTPTTASGRRRSTTRETLKRFRHFVNSDEPDRNVVFVAERGQIRPGAARGTGDATLKAVS